MPKKFRGFDIICIYIFYARCIFLFGGTRIINQNAYMITYFLIYSWPNSYILAPERIQYDNLDNNIYLMVYINILFLYLKIFFFKIRNKHTHFNQNIYFFDNEEFKIKKLMCDMCWYASSSSFFSHLKFSSISHIPSFSKCNIINLYFRKLLL